MGRRLPGVLVLVLVFTWTHRSSAGAYLADLSWPQAETMLAGQLVVVPFAAGAKEHGPHLPLGTDRIVMEHLLEAAVAQRDVVVAPAVLHGWFPAFRGYPGTEVADAGVFQDYLRGVAESLVQSGARRIVFLNLGITRATGLPISIVARDLRADAGIATLVVSWDDLETEETAALYQQAAGGHADEGETSIMLHLRPDLVRMQDAVRDERGGYSEQIGYAPGKFDRDSEVGVFGDPTLASADKGRRILEVMTRNWLTALDQFASATR